MLLILIIIGSAPLLAQAPLSDDLDSETPFQEINKAPQRDQELLKMGSPNVRLDIIEQLAKLNQKNRIEDPRTKNSSPGSPYATRVAIIKSEPEDSWNIAFDRIYDSNGKTHFIQIGAFVKPDYGLLRELKSFGNIFHIIKNNLKIVNLGYYPDMKTAKTYLNQIKEKGFNDAFIITQDRNENDLPIVVPNYVAKASSTPESRYSAMRDYNEPDATAWSPFQESEIYQVSAREGWSYVYASASSPIQIKGGIIRDMATIRNELAKSIRYKVIVLIDMLEVEIDKIEEEEILSAPDTYDPRSETLKEILQFPTAINKPYKANIYSFSKMISDFESNFLMQIEWMDSDAVDIIIQQIENIRHLIAINENGQLTFTKLKNIAFEFEKAINTLEYY